MEGVPLAKVEKLEGESQRGCRGYLQTKADQSTDK